MADEPKPPETPDYSWLEPQPIFVDHFAVDAFAGGIVRFVFGEWLGPDRPPIYRVGIAMVLADAKELVRVLQYQIAQFEEQQKSEADNAKETPGSAYEHNSVAKLPPPSNPSSEATPRGAPKTPGSSQVPKKRKSPTTGGGFPFEEISPQPTQVLRLPKERAHMLATLPRSKLSEIYWAALTGLVGAAPGAVEALHEAYFKEGGLAGLSMFGLLQVGGAIVFFTLFLAGIVDRWNIQT